MEIPSQTDISPPKNNLLNLFSEVRTVDLTDIESPSVQRMATRRHKRELRDMRDKRAADAAFDGLKPGVEIYGFTKGQFSLLHAIEACLCITGPAHLTLSTWTAARHEIVRLAELQTEHVLKSMRFLTDVSFARRDPQAAAMIRDAFGLENVRISQCHAKFFMLQNKAWKLVCRTSMNLNMNPRFEDFTVAHDPEIFDFISNIMDEIWAKQKKELQLESDKTEARRQFDAL